MTTLRLRTALLGSGAAIALLAATGPVAADEIDELRAQINALQDKVTQIQADETAKPSVAPAAAVNAGSKPKSWQLPGTNTSMAIGGYAKLDMIYDINADQGPNLSDGAAEGSTAANKQGHFRLHARQSRLNVKTWTPTDWGELATHIEVDFFGAPPSFNEVVTNSSTFRARHAYGRLGPVMAGQSWSTHLDLGAYPEVLDFAGPTGERFIRQGQIRYTHNLGGGANIQLAVENPQASIRLDTSGTGATSVDHMPDFVVKATKRFSGGHIAGVFVGRYLSADTGGAGGIAFDDSEFGYSLSLSGSYAITPNDTWKFSGSYGDGAGRYQLAGAGNEMVIVTPVGSVAPELRTVTVFGGHTSIRHKWNATTRSNLVFGASKVDIKEEMVGPAPGVAATGAIDRRNSIHANLIWSPVPQVNIGLEYIWQHTSRHNANSGVTSRVQLGMQYKF